MLASSHHRSTWKPPYQGQDTQRGWGSHPVRAHVLWSVPSPGDPQPRTLLLPAGAIVSGTDRWGWRQADSSKHPADPVAVSLSWVAPAHPARSNPCPQGLGRVSLGGQPGRVSPSRALPLPGRMPCSSEGTAWLCSSRPAPANAAVNGRIIRELGVCVLSGLLRDEDYPGTAA